MNAKLPAQDTWIHPFGNLLFLGLDRAGTIRRVAGACEPLLGSPAADLQGMAWGDFIRRCAAESARTGLHYAWLAITQSCVAAAHRPASLPVKPRITACLRPVEQDPEITFALQIASGPDHDLDVLLGRNTLETAQRLTALSQHVFRGADGPLTDLQVQDIGSILNSADYIELLLEVMHAAIVRPLVSAPQPYSIRTLFTFSENEFSDRRALTHLLRIRAELPDVLVYCQDDLRDLVQRILHQLIANISAESAIILTTCPGDNDHTISFEIKFHSAESELRIERFTHPVELLDPSQFDRTHIIERLVTTAQAYLRPVNGRVWAEPVFEAGVTARIVLVLPRWKGALTSSPGPC
jgi:hypothetical protein